jgi:hypothetical protein
VEVVEHPIITSIQLDGNELVITAQVPPGLKKVTLQSCGRLGTGAWEPRAVLRLNGEGGEVTFRVPRSEILEMIRLRADETEPLPSSFYEGQSSFSGVPLGSTLDQPVFLTPGDARAGDAAPPEEKRDVVESDIWKIRGDILYFFNQHRGLQVIELANPDAPLLRGTLPLPAAGEQLYVLPDSVAVLLVRDNCRWDAGSESQVLIVEAGAGDPVVRAALPLSGQIQESRMVGTALYVMTQSYRPVGNQNDGAWEWGTRISAFDLSDPFAPVTRSSIWHSGYGHVLSATDRFAFVSVTDSSSSSVVHCVDISAPDGTMRRAGSIRAAGHVKDKFKMHLNGDVFTVISEKWSWQLPNQNGRWRPVTSLETFSLADPDAPRKLGQLELADGEQLHATRFDGDRVYIVTYFQIDPLWVVDLSDPSRPAVTGELHVPGWSTYIQPLGDRLVAIGIDDTNGWRVAVSLFDVRDPAAPDLLSKVSLGENYSWSEANTDEKAFGLLPESGLILVPYSSYSGTEKQGVQLIDFDGDTLVKRGFIAHKVQARRSTIHRDRIISVSGRELLSVDATDRDDPVVRSETELAWPVDRVFVLGDYVLELEAGSRWENEVTPRLRVAGIGNPERVLNSLTLKGMPVTGAALREGRLYLFQSVSEYLQPPATEDGSVEPGQTVTDAICSVVEVSALPELVLAGTAIARMEGGFITVADPLWVKPDLLVWVARQGWSWGPWRVGVVDSLMPARGGFWPFYGSGPAKLLAVDVRDPGRPEFVSDVALNSAGSWPSFSKAHMADQLVYLSQQYTDVKITGTNHVVVTNLTYTVVTNSVPGAPGPEPVPGSDAGEKEPPPEVIRVPEYTVTTNVYPVYTWLQMSELHVIDYTSPSAPLVRKPITVPGELRGLSGDGALLYLVGQNPAEKAASDGSEWLHACAYDGAAVYLVDSHRLPNSWPRSVLVREPYIYVSLPEVEKTSRRGLEVWTLSALGKFTLLNERALSQNAYSMQRVNDLLAVRGEYDVELFDLTNPVELPAVGRGGPSACLGWDLEHAAGSMAEGLWLPLGLYGAYQIEVKK